MCNSLQVHRVLHWTPIKPWSLLNQKLSPGFSFFHTKTICNGVLNRVTFSINKTHKKKIIFSVQVLWLTCTCQDGNFSFLISPWASFSFIQSLKAKCYCCTRMLMEVNGKVQKWQPEGLASVHHDKSAHNWLRGGGLQQTSTVSKSGSSWVLFSKKKKKNTHQSTIKMHEKQHTTQ